MNDSERALQALGDALDIVLLRALAEPVRIEIVKILMTGEALEVGEIAQRLPQDRTVISRHLKVMEHAGLIEIENVGRRRVCRLRPGDFVRRVQAIVDRATAAMQLCCPAELA